MPSASSPQPVSPLDEPCEVRIDAQVVRYRRAGTGLPVLVLCDDGREGLWPELEPALSRAFRLIVPEIAATDALELRLPPFLEGLGASGVCVVAGPAFCASTADVMALGAEQMDRAIFVAGDRSAARALDASLDPLRPSFPILLLHRGLSAEAAVPFILRFIADGGVRGPG